MLVDVKKLGKFEELCEVDKVKRDAADYAKRKQGLVAVLFFPSHEELPCGYLAGFIHYSINELVCAKETAVFPVRYELDFYILFRRNSHYEPGHWNLILLLCETKMHVVLCLLFIVNKKRQFTGAVSSRHAIVHSTAIESLVN
jgi:hypothetical protein